MKNSGRSIRTVRIAPQYIAERGLWTSIIGNGSEIYGDVHSSVIGGSVTIGKGAVIRDSIIMQGVTIGENCVIDKSIIAEIRQGGRQLTLGFGQ